MAKYRKKPIVIDAMKYQGPIEDSILLEFMDGICKYEKHYLLITTLEGVIKASPGDWIIKGINGEMYPCKPDIFEKTYELVEEQKL